VPDPYWAMEYAKKQVAPGWYGVIERLVADLAALGWDGDVRHVNSDRGALLFLIGRGSERIWKRVDQAIKESIRTCENCGARGWLGICSGCATARIERRVSRWPLPPR